MRAFSWASALCVAVMGLASMGQAAEPTVLFDGKSLDQFDVLGCEAVVQDGSILIKAGNGLVQTKKQYSDYVLECEWKTLHADNWDSGIYFLYKEKPAGAPWPKQYQVNLRKGMEGDLVGSDKGKNPVKVDAHAWNKFELTVRGGAASLQVNGKPAWKVDGLEAGKSFIALQAEVPGGGQFLFRNVKITELAP